MSYRASYLNTSRMNISQQQVDGKDLLIQKLKEDLEDMQNNAGDFQELSRQLKDLELRYESVNMEKVRQEQELKEVQQNEHRRT